MSFGDALAHLMDRSGYLKHFNILNIISRRVYLLAFNVVILVPCISFVLF